MKFSAGYQINADNNFIEYIAQSKKHIEDLKYLSAKRA